MNVKLSEKNRTRLNLINSIIEEYQVKGFRLTLRQLYYQLVSRDIIPNKQNEYAKLSNLLKNGRMAGIVDWDSIEDRIREPDVPFSADSIQEAIFAVANQYRRDRQEGQNNYIEVWCEKDALSNILQRITHKYHVQLMINRGYSSCSAMYDASKRFKRAEKRGQDCKLLYFGDHDPSGLDMVRDVSERLLEFDVSVEVKHIALTTEQVQFYAPPPNPAKITDPRAEWYISKYGKTSWEVDALQPQVLTKLISEEIESIIDLDQFEHMKRIETIEKKMLERIALENGN